MEITSGTTNSTISSSTGTAHRATIAEGSFLINLLVTSLYTNPALAAVREIVANAVDANNMVGRNHIPVLLVLPTKKEPVCVIQDNGPGMPTKLFYDHYICVGDSSKRNDVNQIGGMGIGCKAPLAYSPMFRVVIAFQGKRTQFTVALQSDGYPWAQEDYCVDNDDPTWTSGMRIEIPVRQEDICQFQAIGSKVARWYAVTPVIENLDNPAVLEPLVYAYKLPASNFEGEPSVRELERNGCNPWAACQLLIEMGGLVYPLAAKDLANISQFSPMMVKLLGNMHGVHHAPMGAVTPAPSREALKLDASTIAYIANFADTVIEELAQPILDVLENEKNVSSFEFSRQLYSASNRPRALLQADNYRSSSTSEWIAFFKVVCDLADLKFGKQTRDHRSLALSARTPVLAVPRSIGAFSTADIQLTACTSVVNRGTYKPYKSEVNHTGNLVSSRGSTSEYTLDINKPFHLVYVDCTHAATRVKNMLSAPAAPNVLLVQPKKQPGKDKQQAAAEAKQVAQQIADLHEFRGIVPVSLSSLTADPSKPRVSGPRGKAAVGLDWEEIYGAHEVEVFSLENGSLTEDTLTLAAITAESDPEHTLYLLHNNRGYRHASCNPYSNDSETFEITGGQASEILKSFLHLYEFVHGVIPTVIQVPTQAKANRLKFADQGIRPAMPAFLELGMLAYNDCDLPQLLCVQPPPHMSSYTSPYRMATLVDVIRNLRDKHKTYVPPTPELELIWNAVPVLDKEIAQNEEIRELFATDDPSTLADLDMQQKVYEYQKIRTLIPALGAIPAIRMPEGFTITPPETQTPAQKIQKAIADLTDYEALGFIYWNNVLSQSSTGVISTFLSVCIRPAQIPALQAELDAVSAAATQLADTAIEAPLPPACEMD